MRMENVMKRFSVLSAAALASLSVAGCASAPGSSGNTSQGLGGVPDFVNEAYLNASEDVLIGVGICDIGGDWSKLDAGTVEAETRAQNSIAQYLFSTVKHNEATGEIEIEIDQDVLSVVLRKAQTVKRGLDDNGVLWVVMEFSKSEATSEVNQAVNKAKLEVPLDVALDALQRR
jgi:hypothetical protein